MTGPTEGSTNITEKIETIRRDLEDRFKDSDHERLLDVLEKLDLIDFDKALLSSSKIGVLVNKIRKDAGNETVERRAMSLLLKWKTILVGEARSHHKRAVDDDKSTEDALDSLDPKRPRAMDEAQLENQTIVAGEKIELSDLNRTGDPIRDKCREMLLSALSFDPDEFTFKGDVIRIAIEVEETLCAEFGGKVSNSQFKAKFRSKYLNLKDRANATLRRALLSGIISAEQFCSMTAAEMASDERKRLDSLLNDQNLKNARAAQDTQAETDQFKCGRCKQRKCKYYQMQTRSADEPMTTFVTCVNCGNRWKVLSASAINHCCSIVFLSVISFNKALQLV